MMGRPLLFAGVAAALLAGACGPEAEQANGTAPAAVPASPTPPPVASPPAAPAQDSAVARVDSGAPAHTPPAGSSDREDAAQDRGAEVLARASAAYESLRSLQADFTMVLENPLLRRTTTSRGTLYQLSPDRILLRFSEPEGDVIVGDGTYFWVYYPSVNPDQVTRAPAEQAGSGGVDLRAQFVGDPTERFRYAVEGMDSVNGRAAQVLTLEPRQDAGYRSLRVWIDETDAMVRQFEISEHNGATRRFTFTTLQRNPALSDTLFRFTPPAGVRIVEPPR